MPHPIYGPPSHELDSIHLTLHVGTPRNGRRWLLEAHGRSSTSRASLWSVREGWAPTEQRGGYEPTDAAHHLLLAAAQDRPASQSHLEACLRGEGWEQLALDI
uniref:Uncharacterized protein n=1 Tax=uncultured prokaryote TaxID=198431 RepID=A0A0H5QLL0_9ZZZZ|nr:hypothetical protein [uncultured prokaryote]